MNQISNWSDHYVLHGINSMDIYLHYFDLSLYFLGLLFSVFHCRWQRTTTVLIWSMQLLQGWALFTGASRLPSLASRRGTGRQSESAAGSELEGALSWYLEFPFCFLDWDIFESRVFWNLFSLVYLILSLDNEIMICRSFGWMVK